MAKLYVVEFDRTAIDARGQPVAAPDYSGTVVKQPAVTISGASAQSSAFSGVTRFIQFHTDAICSIAIGDDPTADPLYDRIAANETRFVGVGRGQKIAVVTNT